MNSIPFSLEGHSPTGDGHMTVAPFVTDDGVPKAVLFIRTDVPSVYTAKLDGQPAIAVFLGQDVPGALGNLLTQQWDLAEKLAADRK